MSSVIQLLPEHVANQIAAGEVVNRPASAVKELLENAVDSGASSISLHIQDSGKTLIKVIDNGCGMSEEDARKCFQRYATSKIKNASDLYALTTMGFRGEALASIAAVSQIELNTKRKEDELGCCARVEGEKIKEIKPCTCDNGTQIGVKNIYFNTPARRQFLKSDEVEYKYIEEEFIRVAMVHPEIKFVLLRDGRIVYSLEQSSFKQRIVHLMGKSFEQRLVKVKEDAGKVSIDGFICTPEYFIKNRSKQYLFVNNRYVKHIGLNHAIESAYKQLLPEKNYTAYFLSLKVEPSTIDVNIHPTKTEIRFEDEKLVYGVMLSVVKHFIGVNQISPILDFENMNQSVVDISKPNRFPEIPSLGIDPKYNPFDTAYESKSKINSGLSDTKKTFAGEHKGGRNSSFVQATMQLYSESVVVPSEMEEKETDLSYSTGKVLQVGMSYIVTTVKSGILFIDQQAATERIVYEKYSKDKAKVERVAQNILFPQAIELSQSQGEVLKDIKEDLSLMGWDMEWVGGNSFIVNATPSDVNNDRIQEMIEGLVDGYIGTMMNIRGSREDNITVSMARQMAVRRGEKLEGEEMHNIINRLFASSCPSVSPSGEKIYWIMPIEAIQYGFKEK